MTIKWIYKETQDSEFASFTSGTLTATVQDCDGDWSVWYIMEGIRMILSSPKPIDSMGPMYHFDIAKQQCEQALIVEAKKRNLYNGE